MGGPGELQLYADSERQANEWYHLVVGELQRIQSKYSRYDVSSIVSKINDSAGKRFVAIDNETEVLVNFADAAHRSTGGLFDVTSGVLRKVWKFSEAKVPSESALAEVLQLIGWEKVQLRKGEMKLCKAGMEIDFGGFGKEYGVDRAVGKLLEAGCKHALLNLAGDLRAVGPTINGTSWRVGIVHPRVKNAVVATVELTNGALATSGDYERFFEISGKRYCHILNPKTGHPVQGLQSVSVFSSSCLVAGSRTTSAMLMGMRAAKQYLATAKSNYIMIDNKGRITAS